MRVTAAVARRVLMSRIGRLVAARVANPLFDAAWYRRRYADIPGGWRSWVHWRRHGWKEGRDPNAVFDTRWYLARYPDVADRRIDPLEHYLRWGSAEGRLPASGFDPRVYRERYPDVARTGVDPLLHYLRHGIAEGRTARPPTRPGSR